jgi:hypothetical protein
MEKIFNYPHYGKIISKDFLNGNSEISEVTCPHWGNHRNCKDGKTQLLAEKFSATFPVNVVTGFHWGFEPYHR